MNSFLLLCILFIFLLWSLHTCFSTKLKEVSLPLNVSLQLRFKTQPRYHFFQGFRSVLLTRYFSESKWIILEKTKYKNNNKIVFSTINILHYRSYLLLIQLFIYLLDPQLDVFLHCTSRPQHIAIMQWALNCVCLKKLLIQLYFMFWWLHFPISP